MILLCYRRVRKKTTRLRKVSVPPNGVGHRIDLNAAILKYKAERAGQYNDLRDAIKCRKKGSDEGRQDIFGRNAIARAFGVKAQAMVSKSPEWKEIAKELKLDRKS